MSTTPDLFEQIAALRREGRPFVLATVVGRRAPVSAHLGDRALVYADGRMEGFVGGACAREIVRQQALEALSARCSRLVSIRPDAGDSSPPTNEHVVVPMTCASEGAIDVYVEPFVQPRQIVVVGFTPVAEAVCRLARGMNYAVLRVVDDRELRDVEQDDGAARVAVTTLDSFAAVLSGADSHRDLAAVVASQGHYDEDALECLLRSGVSYVGLVASRARGDTVRALLKERGVPGVESIRSPAGIDLAARTPPEVALSILAEIVRAHPGDTPARIAASDTAVPVPALTAIDPVCGMSVEIASARHHADVEGVSYYFCCPNCRARFVKDPPAYLAHS